MRKFLSILSILLVSVLSTACINNLAVQELNNKAKVFMDKGDYENAISRLEASVDLDDTIFETQYNLAVAYTYANNYKEAIETFGKAINLKPTMAETYYSLGVAQENFAIDVIKGEVNINGEKPSDDEVEEQDNANANANEDSTELSKEDKDFTFNQIERIYGQLNKNIKKKDGQYEFLKGWFNWSTDLVKAPIFLKLNDTAQIDVGTFSGKGPLVQTPSYQQQLAYDQMRNERKK